MMTTMLLWVLAALAVGGMLSATMATTKYLHWRARSRQLVGALEACDRDRQQALSDLRKMEKERDFYRDTARSRQPLRDRLGLTEVRGDPRNGGKGGLHVPKGV